MAKTFSKVIVGILCLLVVVVSISAEGQADKASAGSAKYSSDDPYASARDFYAGKNVTIICPQKPGGTNDLGARLVATYMKDLLGAKSVTVENMSGGTGIVAFNWMTTTGPKDGTVFAYGSQPATNCIVTADPACKFDVTDFEYLGITYEDTLCMAVNPDSKLRDLDTLLNKDDARIGVFGVNDAHTYIAVAFLEAAHSVGLMKNAALVGGYQNNATLDLAAAQGEIDIITSGNNTANKNELEINMIQFRESRARNASDIPTIYEVFPNMNGEARMLLDIIPRNIRLIHCAKGVPEDRVAFLEYCIQEMFADPQFAIDMKNQTNFDFEGGLSAEEATKIAMNYDKYRNDYKSWKSYVAKYVKN